MGEFRKIKETGITCMTGNEVYLRSADSRRYGRRDCYKNLEFFLNDRGTETYGKICALYGLRRSGKTVMMQQFIASLPEENRDDCAYILCHENSSADMDTLCDRLDELLEQGKKYIFIDEITFLKNFQSANYLSDDYGKAAKIVIAGTDSLGIRFAMANALYDRVYTIHTSQVPFAEWARLLGNRSVEDYIRYGGLLTDSQYKTAQERNDYLNTYIADNILHSMRHGCDGRRYFRSLAELYDEGVLKSTINKMIDRFSYKVVLDAILEDYKNIPLHTTVNNAGRRYYRKHLDMDYVTERTKAALDIVNSGESGVNLMEGDLKELKNYLQALDLFVRIPTTTSFERPGKQDDLEILMQPGMVHAHADVLADALNLDRSWRDDCLDEDRKKFKRRAENEICGRILENVLLSETYLAMGTKDRGRDGKPYVSQLSVSGTGENLDRDYEADIIIVDEDREKTYLFEVKYSDAMVETQSKNLRSPNFLKYVKDNFYPVERTAVIYRGQGGFLELLDGTRQEYLNAGKFLEIVHEFRLQPQKEIDIDVLFTENSSRIQSPERKDGLYVDGYDGTEDLVLFGYRDASWKEAADAVEAVEKAVGTACTFGSLTVIKCENFDIETGGPAILKDGTVTYTLPSYGLRDFIEQAKDYACNPSAPVPDFMRNIKAGGPLEAYRKDMNIPDIYEAAKGKNIREPKLGLAEAFAEQLKIEKDYFHVHAGRYIDEADYRPIEDRADEAVKQLKYCLERGIHYSVTEDGIIPEEPRQERINENRDWDDVEDPGDWR